MGLLTMDVAESGLERFQQFFAKPRFGLNCNVGMIWNVRDAKQVRNLGVQEIPHEEAFGQAHLAKLFEALDAGGFSHAFSRFRANLVHQKPLQRRDHLSPLETVTVLGQIVVVLEPACKRAPIDFDRHEHLSLFSALTPPSVCCAGSLAPRRKTGIASGHGVLPYS